MKIKHALATAGMYAGLALATVGVGGCTLSDHYNIEGDGEQPSISLASTLLATRVTDHYSRIQRGEWNWESRETHLVPPEDIVALNDVIARHANEIPWYEKAELRLMQTPASRLPENVRKTLAYGASPTLEFLAGIGIAIYAAGKRK